VQVQVQARVQAQKCWSMEQVLAPGQWWSLMELVLVQAEFQLTSLRSNSN
jgi:hypothetical protein